MNRFEKVFYGTLAAGASLVPAACGTEKVATSVIKADSCAAIATAHPESTELCIDVDVPSSHEEDMKNKLRITLIAVFAISGAAGLTMLSGSPADNERSTPAPDPNQPVDL